MKFKTAFLFRRIAAFALALTLALSVMPSGWTKGMMAVYADEVDPSIAGLTVTADSSEIEVGEKTTVTVQIVEENWIVTSCEPDSNGVVEITETEKNVYSVTGRCAGEARILVKAEQTEAGTGEANTTSAYCDIVVKEMLPSGGVCASEDVASLEYGARKTLTVIPTGDAVGREITWEIAGEAVEFASVAMGESVDIQAVRPGEATVTARCGEYSAVIAVNVERKELRIVSILDSNGQLPVYNGMSAVENLEVTVSGFVDDAQRTEILMATAVADGKLTAGLQSVELTYTDLSVLGEEYVVPETAELKIMPAPVDAIVTSNPAGKAYDGTTNLPEGLLEAELSGVLNEDTVGAVVQGGQFASAVVGEEIVISGYSVQLTGEDAGNYSLVKTNAECVGNITKNNDPNAVLLLVTMFPEDEDMMLRLTATGAFDGCGLEGTATVKFGDEEQRVYIENGIGELLLPGQAALKTIEVTFQVAENVANYAGSFTKNAGYDDSLPGQSVTIDTVFEDGAAIAEGIVYGQTPRLTVSVMDVNGEPIADPDLLFISEDRAAATIDQTGTISVVDASKGSVTFTVQAVGNDRYNASSPVSVIVDLKKVAVEPLIFCDGKVFDGTNTAAVSGSVSGLLTADEGLVDLINTETGLTGTYSQSDAGKDIVVTAENLALAGTLANGVPAENNYELVALTANCTASIEPASLARGQLTMTTDAGDGKTMYYTGQPREPEVAVTMDLDGDLVYETTLVPERDYTVQYKDNTGNTNQAQITVLGTGNYQSVQTTAFSIAFCPAPENVIVLTGNNGGVPVEELRYGGNNSGSSDAVYWYNSAVTLTPAENYGISATLPTAGEEIQEKIVFDKETLDALVDSRVLYVQELSTGAVSQVNILDVIAIDLTAPLLKDARSAEGNLCTENGTTKEYFNRAFTVTWTVEEKNYNSAQVSAGASSTVAPLASVTIDTASADAITVTVDPKGKEIDAEEFVPFLMVTDAAGNKLVLDAEYTGEETVLQDETISLKIPRVLDNVAPVLSVAIAANETGEPYYHAQLQNENYAVSVNEPYRSEEQAFAVLAVADGSPTKLAYKVTSSVSDQSSEVTLEDSAFRTQAAANLNFTGEQRFIINTLAVEDAAGNRSVAGTAESNASNYIYLDATVPENDELAPLVSLVATETGQGQSTAGVPLYKDNVQIEAKLKDPYFGGSESGAFASGLAGLHYSVTWRGENMPLENTAVESAADGRVNGTQIAYTAETIGEDTVIFTFDKEKFNFNDITLTVWAEDWAGNKSGEVSYTFGIDITAPSISVAYDNNNAQNDKYFKENRVATVTVVERNFDPDATNILTQAAASVSEWVYKAGDAPNGDEDTWTCKVSFTADGDYTFNVTAKDRLGHEAGDVDFGDSVAPTAFVLDKTAPVIRIDFDNNDVRNERFYNRARVATITITERNFSSTDAVVDVEASIAEGTVVAPNVDGWSVSEERNTGTVRFTADGDYSMSVKFVDLAGNQAESVQTAPFTVDTTAPTLEIGGVEDRSANKGDVAPSITYHDINYNPATTSVTITGYKNVEGNSLSGVSNENAMGGSYVCENIEPIPENDDVYQCVGHVEDLAGNVSEQILTFSVNRFGSNYILSQDTQALVDDYYTNQRPTLQVTEINVDTLEFMEITASCGGTVSTLEQGKDYTVIQNGDETTWKEYVYTISADSFESDGAYSVTIFSRDEAENENSNRTARQDNAKPIDFALDTTAPTVVITGVDNDQTYFDNTRSVIIYTEDNIRLDRMQLFLNGELVAEYDEAQLEAADGTVTYEAQSSSRWQELSVTVVDKAGNTQNDVTVRYLLTKNLFVQYINSTPALVVSAVVALGCVCGIFLLRHKKKEEQHV